MEEKNTFLHSFIITKDGKSEAISYQEVINWTANQGLLWVHLDFNSPEAATWISKHSKLNKLTQEALLEEDTRPRIVDADNGHLISLRCININPGDNREDLVSIRLWINDSMIISMRHTKVEAINDIKKSFIEGVGPRNSGEFLVMLSDKITDRINGLTMEIGDNIDALEEEMLDANHRLLRQKYSSYRRMVISLRRYLIPQRDVFYKILNENSIILSDSDRFKLREVSNQNMLLLEELDAFRDRVVVLQEELTAQLAEKMNKTIYSMSIVATIFLPLGFFTGLFGINIGGMPGVENPLAFSIFCGFIISLAILEYVFFKWKQLL